MELQAFPEPIEIEQSSFRLFLRTIRSTLFMVFGGACLYIVTLLPPHSAKDGVFVLFCVLLIIGFGLKTVGLAWKLLTVSSPVITLSKQGMRDTRISTDFVPWNAITWTLEAPYTWGYGPARKPTFLTMVIDETIDKQLRKTSRCDVEEISNRFKGYEFTSHGLAIELEELIEHIYAFSRAANVDEERYKVLKFRKRGRWLI